MGDGRRLELAAANGPGAWDGVATALARAAADGPIEGNGGVAVPLVAGDVTLGAIVALPAGSELLIDVELVRAVADLTASAFALDSRVAASHAEARRDAVTGLGNRRAFDEQVAEAIGAAASSGRRIALLMVDLDDFKSVNDSRVTPLATLSCGRSPGCSRVTFDPRTACSASAATSSP